MCVCIYRERERWRGRGGGICAETASCAAVNCEHAQASAGSTGRNRQGAAPGAACRIAREMNPPRPPPPPLYISPSLARSLSSRAHSMAKHGTPWACKTIEVAPFPLTSGRPYLKPSQTSCINRDVCHCPCCSTRVEHSANYLRHRPRVCRRAVCQTSVPHLHGSARR